MIAVYLDNCVWDFLFEKKLDLETELPTNEFAILMTREAEFELPDKPNKKQLRDFIDNTIKNCNIKTISIFGFSDPSLPANKQRAGNFKNVRFANPKETAFSKNQAQKRHPRSKKQRPTGLYKDEADIALAARSMNSCVLTLDKKDGPLKDAADDGGKVIYLNDFDKSDNTLREFILKYMDNFS